MSESVGGRTYRLKCPDCGRVIAVDEVTPVPCGCAGSTWRIDRDVEVTLTASAPVPDADMLYYWWMEGSEDLAVSEIANATRSEVRRFCEMLAAHVTGGRATPDSSPTHGEGEHAD